MSAENTTIDVPERLRSRARADGQAKYRVGKADWSAWPIYDGADVGLRNYCTRCSGRRR